MMDEFYIVRQWFDTTTFEVGFYPTLADAETGLKSSVVERRKYCDEDYDKLGNIHYRIHLMVNQGNECLEDCSKYRFYDYNGNRLSKLYGVKRWVDGQGEFVSFCYDLDSARRDIESDTSMVGIVRELTIEVLEGE